jgi:phenylalanine-4-hydroxylase
MDHATNAATPTPTLPAGHPGFADATYRARRDAIARLAIEHHADEPPPVVEYTRAEHEVWRCVRAHLDPLHEAHACAEIRAAQRALPLSAEAIPQLSHVSAALAQRTGFRLSPVPGLVEPRPFFVALDRGTFLATQYVRHGSVPLYTPEPDVVHELVGHVAALAHPRIAALARRFGALARVADDRTLRRIQRVFWFSLEFGLCRERGEIKAVGAGLLSSAGELARAMALTDRRAWDLETMARTDYGTTAYQEALFVAPSFDALVDETADWLARERARLRRH